MFEIFHKQKLTMREGIIRVLENNIDHQLLRNEENDHLIKNSEDLSEDESKCRFNLENSSVFHLDSIAEWEDFDGKYTISDIANALGMRKDEKTMSRILTELKKVHKQIDSDAVRNGRIFQYKYYLKNSPIRLNPKGY